MRPLTVVAKELEELACLAEERQKDAGSTTVDKQRLSELREKGWLTETHCVTSLIIDWSQHELRFLMNRERVPEEAREADAEPVRPRYRKAPFGGKILSEKEKGWKPERWDEMDKALLQKVRDDGPPEKRYIVRPNAWYVSQGIHMLETGKLEQHEYKLGSQELSSDLRPNLVRHIRTKTSREALRHLWGPVFPNVPVAVTNVCGMNLDPYTAQIKEKYGMKTDNNEKPKFLDLVTTVNEHFGAVEIKDDSPDEFLNLTQGNVVILTPDELIDIAYRATKSMRSWQDRFGWYGITKDILPVLNNRIAHPKVIRVLEWLERKGEHYNKREDFLKVLSEQLSDHELKAFKTAIMTCAFHEPEEESIRNHSTLLAPLAAIKYLQSYRGLLIRSFRSLYSRLRQ